MAPVLSGFAARLGFWFPLLRTRSFTFVLDQGSASRRRSFWPTTVTIHSGFAARLRFLFSLLHMSSFASVSHQGSGSQRHSFGRQRLKGFRKNIKDIRYNFFKALGRLKITLAAHPHIELLVGSSGWILIDHLPCLRYHKRGHVGRIVVLLVDPLCHSQQDVLSWPSLVPGSTAGIDYPGVVIFREDLNRDCKLENNQRTDGEWFRFRRRLRLDVLSDTGRRVCRSRSVGRFA
jgi:hypothetical protein